VQGSRGTDIHAGRVFAIQARYRNVLPFSQRDDFNSCAPGVAHLVMVKGTDQFARAAAAANIFRVPPILKVTDPLFRHVILQTQNITD
jgi:hypothetical protein